MKLHIRVGGLIVAAAMLFSSCNKDENPPIETDTDGRPVFATDELGQTVLPLDKDGAPIPFFTHTDGRLMVFTDEKGSYTPFTDINGGEIPYIVNCSGEVQFDSSGFPLTEESTPDPLKPTNEVKVGFLYNGTIAGDTLNKSFENAREEMKRSFNVETCYIENVLVQQFDEAVEVLKNEGCNVIVAASNHFVTAANLVAKNETDKTKYIVFGGSNSDLRQASVQPLIYQPAYVCGLVAAYNTESNRVGVVADNNFYNVETVVNAFALGVEELPNSNVSVYLNWALSDAYSDTSNAIDDLVAAGCDVILFYQATEYGINYAESIGVKNIGFSYRMPDIAPNTYLAGFNVNLNIFLNDKITASLYDNFRGERVLGGLTSKMVAMSDINRELCKEGTEQIVGTLYDFVYNETSPVYSGEIRDTAGIVRVDKGASLTKEQILNVDWLIWQFKNIGNFSAPRTESDLFPSDFRVRY